MGKVQVNVQVTEEMREGWKEYAADQGLPMSAMIRQAVQAHMNGSTSREGQVEDSRVSDVIEQNKHLQSKLDTLTDDIAAIKNRVETPNERERHTSQVVFNALPSEEVLRDQQQDSRRGSQSTHGTNIDGNPRYVRDVVQSGAIEDMAEVLRHTPAEVEQAVVELCENTSLVKETVIDGTRRFYK